MERKIWHNADEESLKKDSLYASIELLREYMKTEMKCGNPDFWLEKIYLKIEELRKR